MKPHEQEWARSSVDWRVVEDASSGLVVADVRPSPSEGGKDVARLIAAAPDMARALLAIRDRAADAGAGIGAGRTAEQVADMDMDIRLPAALVRDALAALRKAGVLP